LLEQAAQQEAAKPSTAHLITLAALQQWVGLVQACSPDLVHTLSKLSKFSLCCRTQQANGQICAQGYSTSAYLAHIPCTGQHNVCAPLLHVKLLVCLHGGHAQNLP
jgi:hypothetical protein